MRSIGTRNSASEPKRSAVKKMGGNWPTPIFEAIRFSPQIRFMPMSSARSRPASVSGSLVARARLLTCRAAISVRTRVTAVAALQVRSRAPASPAAPRRPGVQDDPCRSRRKDRCASRLRAPSRSACRNSAPKIAPEKPEQTRCSDPRSCSTARRRTPPTAASATADPTSAAPLRNDSSAARIIRC